MKQKASHMIFNLTIPPNPKIRGSITNILGFLKDHRYLECLVNIIKFELEYQEHYINNYQKFFCKLKLLCLYQSKDYENTIIEINNFFLNSETSSIKEDDFFEFLKLKAECQMHMGDFKKALKTFHTLYKRSTLRKNEFFYIAACYYALGNYDDCLKNLDNLKENEYLDLGEEILFLKAQSLGYNNEFDKMKEVFFEMKNPFRNPFIQDSEDFIKEAYCFSINRYPFRIEKIDDGVLGVGCFEYILDYHEDD